MLRNLFLNTSAISYAPPDDDGNKTAAELEREEIALTELPPSKDKEAKDDKSDTDDKGDNKESETAEAEADDSKEEKEEVEEQEEAEETPEEKAIREADEAANAETKSKRQVERMQKRIDTLTAKTRTTEAENAELKKLLDAKKEDGTLTLTEEEVERRAELKAQEKVANRQFEKAVTSLANGANALDKEFNKNIKNVTDEIGLLPPVMIGILEDLESEHTGKKVGSEVLVYLSKNIDDYEDVFGLSEGKMALKLQSIANKITKKAAKPVSRVPAPNSPIGGGRVSTALHDSMSDDEWIRKREAETGGGFRRKA